MQESSSPATIWSRIIAFGIDCVVLCLLMYALGYAGGVVAALVWDDPSIDGLLMVLNVTAASVWVVYFAGLEASPWRGTIGKRAMSIAVTSLDGERITFARALLRHALKAASFFTLFTAYLMALFTKRRQALHDKLSKTVVLKSRRTISPSGAWRRATAE